MVYTPYKSCVRQHHFTMRASHKKNGKMGDPETRYLSGCIPYGLRRSKSMAGLPWDFFFQKIFFELLKKIINKIK